MNDYLANVTGRNMRIISLRIADTGTYDDQWSRPYQSVIGSDFRGVVDSLVEQGVSSGRSITPGMFSNIAGEIIKPQAQPEGNQPIAIANGWQTNRFRWTMLIEIQSAFSSAYQMLTGYTDFRGIGLNGDLDPNMVFTISNSMMLSQSTRPSPSGNRTIFNVTEASHVLAHNESSGMNVGNQKFRMRPTDVFSAMDMTHVADDLFSSGGMDTRTLVTQEAVKASRASEIPTNYVAGIMDSYNRALAAEKYGQDDQRIFETAIDNSRDPVMAKDSFIRAISNMRGTVGSNWFTWRELVTLDRNVENDQITKVAIMGSPRQYVNDKMAVRGDAMNWGTSTLHTQIATTLAQAVPAIMMSLGFASLRFFATNRTINKQFAVQTTGYKDFASSLSTIALDMTEQLMMFQNRVALEVMPNVSQGSQLDMELEMEVNIVGETYIRLSAGSDPITYEYVVPSFMDAAFTPLMTTDIRRPTDIARDFHMLMDNTIGEKHHAPNYAQDQNGQPITQPLNFNIGGGHNPADLI